MSPTLLQLLGGGGYLLQKVFLAFAERAKKRLHTTSDKYWRIAAWIAYLIGLPLIVWLFVVKHNWIAALVEASGAPTMVLGLVNACSKSDKAENEKRASPKWLNILAVVSALLGFTISFWDFGGITTLNQVLEIVMVAGYLRGTYLIANERPNGYLWYFLMHASCGWLMWIQDYRLMVAQQILSIGFTSYAYYQAKSAPRSPTIVSKPA